MMNDIQIFNNPEFGNIRTVVIDNEPWFVGVDVSRALGYKDNTSALRNVDKEDKKIRWCSISTPSGTQKATIINESGLYSLIFGSKLESAKKFKTWVTRDVLPSIRKTGTYSPKELPMTTEQKVQLLAQSDVEIRAELQTVKEDLESLKMDLPILPIEQERITEAVRKKGTEVLGGKRSNAYQNRSIQQKVYKSIYANVKYNFGVKTYRAIKRADTEKAIEIINAYKPPYFIMTEIENENSQQTLAF